jgi:hypothetical protein
MSRIAIVFFTLCAAACGDTLPTGPTPNIEGQWSGRYLVTSCRETGAASGFCQAFGTDGGLVFTAQQSGTNLSGTLSLGGISPFPVTGAFENKRLVITLSGRGPIPEFNATISLTEFRGFFNPNNLSGPIQYTISSASPVATATVVANFSIRK